MVPAGRSQAVTPVVASGLSPVRTRLENGAVITVQETSLSPAVTISAAFQAGSLYEPAGLTGLACLASRVIDRGTERRSADRLAEELDDRGVSLRVGSDRHQMTLSCTCLAEDFDDVLSIVLDVARRPSFPEDELVKRRAETITAIRQDEDNPAVRAGEALFELLYGSDHPYGRRMKGTIETVVRIDRAALQTFHARRIRPSVLSLVIVGDLSAARALASASSELSGWDGDPPERVDVPPPPAAASRRERVIAMPGKSQTDIAYGFTTIRRLDPRFYAYWMMNNILGQFGLGGRLADNIRERQGMAYYAFSGFDPGVGEGPLLIRAGVDPRNVERAVEAIDQEVGRLGTEGPTAEELSQTRESLIGSIPRLLESNQSIAAFLQNSEQFGLGLDYDRRLPDSLRGVTMDEVRHAAAEVLRPASAALAVAGPAATASGEPSR
jgi:zinc protease